MKIISIVMLILLTSCHALEKHADDLKVIGHEVVDEEVDEIKVAQEPEKK